MRGNSRRLALCGISGALAAVIMLMGGIIPFATYAAPAIAGILILPIVVEYGVKSGILLYVTISILSFFVVPDKEMFLMFVLILGYYPLLKIKLELIKPAVFRMLVKLCVFNTSIACIYALMILVLRMDLVIAEFRDSGMVFIIALIIMANLTFVIYDFALRRIVNVYCAIIKPKLDKMH